MARNQIKFIDRGFHAVLNSGGTARVVGDAAYRIAHQSGHGTRVRTMHGGFGGGRPIAIVATHARTPEEADAAREALESAVM